MKKTTKVLAMVLSIIIGIQQFTIIGKVHAEENVEKSEVTYLGEGEELFYKVRRGDTLSRIYEKTGVPPIFILACNPRMKMEPGEKLKLKKISIFQPRIIKWQEKMVDFTELENMIQEYKNSYYGMRIGVGIYQISEEKYVYSNNITEEISSACTVKAAYAAFVLKTCADEGIDIDNTTLLYTWDMINYGSGNIKELATGQEFSIRYLVTELIRISDNTAYNILLSRFSLSDFQKFLNGINGQELNGARYGACTVERRINEWRMIVEYCDKSKEPNAKVLKEILANAQYDYLAQYFEKERSILHKSGWSESYNYPCCGDGMAVDDYIIVVIIDDHINCMTHLEYIKQIGKWCEDNLLN